MATVTIKWMDDGEEKVSTIGEDKVMGTQILTGKNQPFGMINISISPYLFAEYHDGEGAYDSGVWDEDIDSDNYNPKPKIKLGESRVSVSTFGSVEDYIITSMYSEEDYTTIIAHHPAYKLIHTDISSLFIGKFKIENVYSIYNATFDIGLGEYSEVTVPTDWERARYNRGCQSTYRTDFTPTPDSIDSGYKTPGSDMDNLSKYTSGTGYYGTKESARSKYTFWYQEEGMNIIFHLSVKNTSQGYIRNIEWMEGQSDDIVRFILKYGVGESIYPQTFSEAKTYYPDSTSTNPSVNDLPKTEYWDTELRTAKEKGLQSMNPDEHIFGTPIGDSNANNKITDRIRIRVGANHTCKSIIEGIATLTNRYYHFSEEGFFLTNNEYNSDVKKYTIDSEGIVSPIEATINTQDGVLLDFDSSRTEVLEEGGTSITAEVVSKPPEIQDNTDGVVISSQSVYSENYNCTIANVSASGVKEGRKILLPLTDMSDGDTVGANSYRNRMTRLCGYNELVKKFEYEDSIIYTTSETSEGITSGDWIFTDYNDFTEAKIRSEYMQIGKTILYDDGIVIEKLMYTDAGVWVDVPPISSSGEDFKYSSDSCTKLLKDNYNGLLLENVPLAFIVRTYPEHTTTLAWGKSHTNDMSERLREQDEDISQSTVSGGEDVGISDKYSSRLVVGNMTQSQMSENLESRSGFTGLIMEKNVGAELYRLSGYDNGILQAEFDTRGRISAGGGGVILDKDGLKTGSGNIILDGDGLRLNLGSGDVIITEDKITNIEGNVTLDKYGLTFERGGVNLSSAGLTLNQGGVSLTSSGLNVGNGKAILNTNGLTFTNRGGVSLNYNGLNIGNGKVILNGAGLSTGAGSVTFNERGMTIYTDSSSYVERDALTFRKQGGTTSAFDTARIYSTQENNTNYINIHAYDENSELGTVRIFNRFVSTEEALEDTTTHVLNHTIFSDGGGDNSDVFHRGYRRIDFRYDGGGPNGILVFMLVFNKPIGKFGGTGRGVIDSLLINIHSVGSAYNRPMTAKVEYYGINGSLDRTESVYMKDKTPGKYEWLHLQADNTPIEVIKITFTGTGLGGLPLIIGDCIATKRTLGGTIEVDSKGVSISGNIHLEGNIYGSANITGPIVDNIRGLIRSIDIGNYTNYYPLDLPNLFITNTWIGIFDTGFGFPWSTGSALIVTIVTNTQWQEISVRKSPTSGEMLVAKSSDKRDGDGHSTHTFVLPYGGSFKFTDKPRNVSLAELTVK